MTLDRSPHRAEPQFPELGNGRMSSTRCSVGAQQMLDAFSLLNPRFQLHRAWLKVECFPLSSSFYKIRLRGLHKERLPGSSGLVMRSELCVGGERETPGGNDLPRGRGEDLETGRGGSLELCSLGQVTSLPILRPHVCKMTAVMLTPEEPL